MDGTVRLFDYLPDIAHQSVVDDCPIIVQFLQFARIVFFTESAYVEGCSGILILYVGCCLQILIDSFFFMILEMNTNSVVSLLG